MRSPPSTELTDAQVDQLVAFLDSIDGAMSLEEIDGFYCALISAPDQVMPSEYLPHVFGGKLFDFSSDEQAGEIMGLLFQHWNHIAYTLLRDEIHFPFLCEDEAGTCQANDWADGYMLGVQMRRESWSVLMNDEENAGMMVPVMALILERYDDHEYRPLADDKREDIIARMIASILDIYRYFAPERKHEARPIQHSHLTIGHNDRCYCGSGEKRAHCHGAEMLH